MRKSFFKFLAPVKNLTHFPLLSRVWDCSQAIILLIIQKSSMHTCILTLSLLSCITLGSQAWGGKTSGPRLWWTPRARCPVGFRDSSSISHMLGHTKTLFEAELVLLFPWARDKGKTLSSFLFRQQRFVHLPPQLFFPLLCSVSASITHQHWATLKGITIFKNKSARHDIEQWGFAEEDFSFEDPRKVAFRVYLSALASGLPHALR